MELLRAAKTLSHAILCRSRHMGLHASRQLLASGLSLAVAGDAPVTLLAAPVPSRETRATEQYWTCGALATAPPH